METLTGEEVLTGNDSISIERDICADALVASGSGFTRNGSLLFGGSTFIRLGRRGVDGSIDPSAWRTLSARVVAR